MLRSESKTLDLWCFPMIGSAQNGCMRRGLVDQASAVSGPVAVVVAAAVVRGRLAALTSSLPSNHRC
jgi:hypothetical protein